MNKEDAKNWARQLGFVVLAVLVIGNVIIVDSLGQRLIAMERNWEITKSYLDENPIPNPDKIKEYDFMLWVSNLDENTYAALASHDDDLNPCISSEMNQHLSNVDVHIQRNSYIFEFDTGNQLRFNTDGTVTCYVSEGAILRRVECNSEEICQAYGSVSEPITGVS